MGKGLIYEYVSDKFKMLLDHGRNKHKERQNQKYLQKKEMAESMQGKTLG